MTDNKCPTAPEQANQFDLDSKLAAAGDKPVLVQFVSPWCGHCVEAKPKVAEATQRLCGKATVLAVDGTLAPALVEKYKVDGFPTMLLFKNGKLVRRLDGIDSADEVVKFAEGRAKK